MKGRLFRYSLVLDLILLEHQRKNQKVILQPDLKDSRVVCLHIQKYRRQNAVSRLINAILFTPYQFRNVFVWLSGETGDLHIYICLKKAFVLSWVTFYLRVNFLF